MTKDLRDHVYQQGATFVGEDVMELTTSLTPPATELLSGLRDRGETTRRYVLRTANRRCNNQLLAEIE